MELAPSLDRLGDSSLVNSYLVADATGVTLIDAMHYGMEKPPQLAMVEWFRARGIDASFVPDGPK